LTTESPAAVTAAVVLTVVPAAPSGRAAMAVVFFKAVGAWVEIGAVAAEARACLTRSAASSEASARLISFFASERVGPTVAACFVTICSGG
jgi:hypothetical protein